MSEQDFPGSVPTVAADAAAVLQRLFDLISATNRAADPNWQEKVLALVADDYEGIEVPVGKIYHGVEGFKEFTLRWQTAVPDNTIEIINRFATQDQVCLEYIVRATHQGPLHFPLGVIEPTGQRIEHRISDIWRVRDGKIVSQHTYYDVLTIMQQVGVLPRQQESASQQAVMEASLEENKAIARRFYELGMLQGDTTIVDECCSPDLIYYFQGFPEIHDFQSLKQSIAQVPQAFSNLSVPIDWLVAEGDKVVMYLTGTGIQRGTLGHKTSEGTLVHWKTVMILAFANRKIIQGWVYPEWIDSPLTT